MKDPDIIKNNIALITSVEYFENNIVVMDSIKIYVPFETNISEEKAIIKVNKGASIEPNPSDIIFTLGIVEKFRVTAEDGTTKEYVIIVSIEKNKEAIINSLKYLDVDTPIHDEIIIKVPYKTDISKEKIVVEISRNATISPDPFIEVFEFDVFKKFVITSESGNTKEYSIKVIMNDNKDSHITSIKYLDKNIIVYDNIEISVAYGTDISKEKIELKISENAEIQPLPSTVVFVDGVGKKFIVTSQNGNTKEYTITINIAENDKTLITTLQYMGKQIAISDNIEIDVLPNVDVSNAKAIISISEKAKISPNPNDVTFEFDIPQKFIVTGEDGSTKEYYITVSFIKNSDSTILSLNYLSLSPVITENIIIELPYKTDISGVKSIIIIDEKAEINPLPENTVFYSDITQVFVVTAEDGSENTYNITVKVSRFASKGSRLKLENNEWVIDNINGTHTGIYSIEDLAMMGSGNTKPENGGDIWRLNDDYILLNDLDFNDENSYRAGYLDYNLIYNTGFKPIGDSSSPFEGSLNGLKHYIKNLYINTVYHKVGLFGVIQDSYISNLGILNANISGADYTAALVGSVIRSDINRCYVDKGSVTGDSYTAGLVGRIYNNSNIDRCYTSCLVQSKENRTGGLVGYNKGLNSDITNSYSTSDIISISTEIGGLVGYSYNGGNTNYCYYKGNIKGKNNVGGLIGYIKDNTTKIESSIAFASVIEATNSNAVIGRVVGYIELSLIINCYSNIDMTLNGNLIITDIGPTTKQGDNIASMINVSLQPFFNWDFVNIWELKSGAIRPTLIGVGDDQGK
ncbi:MAG: DUF5018 domain-containing protein [Flavobacteriaceae bacterium]|nr:DUF5018 domain-containing protein [Flavobacteriaceae bacterium]